MANKVCEICKDKSNQIYNDKFYFYIKKEEEKFQEILNRDFKITYTKHVKKRMYERCISEKEIISAIHNGWFIQSGKNEALILSYTKVGQVYRPIHVFVGYTECTIRIVTTYRPDHFSNVWDENYEKQLCFCLKKKKEMY